MSLKYCVLNACVVGCLTSITAYSQTMQVPLYRVFETEIPNTQSYANKFSDVELTVRYISPSGKRFDFWGFYDGNGQGEGDATTGHIWKIRFMPGELGQWQYHRTWSDGTEGGSGDFICVAKGAGKGVLQAYQDNPHWFAYNGTEPVWLKSYYETGHGSIAQEFEWITANVYLVPGDDP